MFAKLRRKGHGELARLELGQSAEHLRQAASHAAQATGATVGPKLSAAYERVQPAATKARDAASGGWDSAVSTLQPLVTAAAEKAQQAGKDARDAGRKAGKEARKAGRKAGRVAGRKAAATDKKAQKRADRLAKAAERAVGRSSGRRSGRLVGLALAGAAIGAGAAYVLKRRRAAQWTEYDPAEPAGATAVVTDGADDAAFEPTPPATATPTDPALTGEATLGSDTTDQTSSAQHSPTVARMASGDQKN